MEKMRIHIIEPVGGHGGMDFYDYGLAEGLAAQGAVVGLYTCSKTNVRSSEGVETHAVFGDVWSKKGLAKGIQYLKSYRRAFREADQKKAAVVHFHLFEVGWLNLIVLRLARRFRFKKVVTLHDVDPLASHASQKIHARTYALCDKIIVHNAFSRDELLKKGVSTEKIAVIPHGNYLPFIEALPTTPKEEKLRILFFGQIKSVKGLDLLLDALHLALKKTPHLHLTIAGRPWRANWDIYAQKIKALELEKAISLRIEYVPNNEVPALFAQSDLIVLPYRRIYQSGVLLLSMSYGKPCLTSDLEPFREIITHGETGLLFRSESAEDLAGKLVWSAEHHSMLSSIAEHALDCMKSEFDWTTIGAKTLQLYRSIPGITE